MTDRLISCDDHMDLSQLPSDLWTTRLPASLLDMRRAVEQRRGQPCRPQICGQLAKIHVIVAGDEPVSHVILRSMDVSRAWRQLADPTASRRSHAQDIASCLGLDILGDWVRDSLDPKLTQL